MDSILAHFDQVRIINLASRADRKAECIQEFARWGLPMDNTRFYTATKPTVVPAYWQHLPAGVYGCFMSHLTVLKKFSQSNDSRLLVMEDDIQFDDPYSARVSPFSL